tara:strand:- start:80 stop:346 length:267 start_codon:yes stop_codon:yes gene_type:complete
MVAETLALIGIALLVFISIVTAYAWIMGKLNGQTTQEYIDDLADKLNEAEKQAKLNPAPWYVKVYYRLRYYLIGGIISFSLFYVIEYL